MTKTGKQLALLGALIIGFTAYMWHEAANEPRSTKQPVKLDQAAMCRAALPMKVSFKDPASIQIAAMEPQRFKDGSTVYHMDVLAKNSFGGTTLTRCQCAVQGEFEPIFYCAAQ